MTKKELIIIVAKHAGISKLAARKAIDSYIFHVSKELKQAGKLGLIGFGTFKVVKRKKRTGRNPRTGERIKIATKKVVTFKSGKGFKEEVIGTPIPPPRRK